MEDSHRHHCFSEDIWQAGKMNDRWDDEEEEGKDVSQPPGRTAFIMLNQ